MESYRSVADIFQGNVLCLRIKQFKGEFTNQLRKLVNYLSSDVILNNIREMTKLKVYPNS